MPIYEYRCRKCGQVIEVDPAACSDRPLRKCRELPGRMEKIVSRTAFLLKGGGWYAEGYTGPGKNGKNGKQDRTAPRPSRRRRIAPRSPKAPRTRPPRPPPAPDRARRSPPPRIPPAFESPPRLTGPRGPWNNFAFPGKGAPMKVLLIGGGGREHALAWAIGAQPASWSCCARPRATPASRRHAEPVGHRRRRTSTALRRARRATSATTWSSSGPRRRWSPGSPTVCATTGWRSSGRSGAAARIEGSKVFAKQFMDRHGIPTAGYQVFDAIAAAAAVPRAPATSTTRWWSRPTGWPRARA